MKKILALLLCAATLLGMLAGCGTTDNSAYVPTGDALFNEGDDLEEYLYGTEEEIDVLTLGYYPDRSMNPLVAATYTNRVLLSLMYQGLFAVNNNYEVTPILCSRYRVSPDNMIWTFYVEVGATFSDGTSVTINDVFASYEKAKTTDYYKGRFTHVTKMEISEDGGITFTTNTPYENFPLLLDVPIVKASDVDAEFPIGSGPYVFTEGSAGPCLMKVANWWCAQKAKLADLTGEGKLPTNPRFELFLDKAGAYRFRLRARNGQVVAVSEDYTTREACEKGMESVRKNAAQEM